VSITAILGGIGDGFKLLLFEMSIEFCRETALDQGFDELLEDAAFAYEVFGVTVFLEQFIN
jgi:hypothetical protein